MKLVVGLGNPEKRYFKTRHNAGRLAVEVFARQLSLQFTYHKSELAWCAKGQMNSEEVLIAFPDLFMNQSGESVERLVRFAACAPSTDLLVVLDDAAIPFGSLRLRLKGSDGGHNGLRSIDRFLSGADYARLRLGIGHQGKSTETPEDITGGVPLEDFVLAEFSKEEDLNLALFLNQAAGACKIWCSEPGERAVNRVNSASALKS